MDYSEVLHQISLGNSQYVPMDGPRSFLVTQITAADDGVQVTSTLIDSGIPDSGGIEEYLQMNAAQRVALDLLRITEHASEVIAAHGAFDRILEEYAEIEPEKVLNALIKATNRALAQRFLALNGETPDENEPA